MGIQILGLLVCQRPPLHRPGNFYFNNSNTLYRILNCWVFYLESSSLVLCTHNSDRYFNHTAVFEQSSMYIFVPDFLNSVSTLWKKLPCICKFNVENRPILWMVPWQLLSRSNKRRAPDFIMQYPTCCVKEFRPHNFHFIYQFFAIYIHNYYFSHSN